MGGEVVAHLLSVERFGELVEAAGGAEFGEGELGESDSEMVGHVGPLVVDADADGAASGFDRVEVGDGADVVG